jgi:hypothetical protein
MDKSAKPDVLGRLYTRGVAGVETREQLLEMKELLAEAERERDELRAEVLRLRVFLKYVKGKAQDQNDLELMDQIDDMLAGAQD